MSAPHETFIAEIQTTPLGYHNGAEPKLVRYLRADLTCGECGSHYDEMKCPNQMEYFDKHGESFKLAPIATTPACMAFVPKETP